MDGSELGSPSSEAPFKQEEKKLGTFCRNELSISSEVNWGCKCQATKLSMLGSKGLTGRGFGQTSWQGR